MPDNVDELNCDTLLRMNRKVHRGVSVQNKAQQV